jgi:hypothetical protein
VAPESEDSMIHLDKPVLTDKKLDCNESCIVLLVEKCQRMHNRHWNHKRIILEEEEEDEEEGETIRIHKIEKEFRSGIKLKVKTIRIPATGFARAEVAQRYSAGLRAG